jgi:hypothetical protein
MRATPLIIALTAIAALPACQKRPAAAAIAAAAIIPGGGEAPRPSGLWEERVTDRDGVSISQLCLDDASAGQLSYLGRQLGGRCQRNVMEQAANGEWHFTTTCDAGAVTTQGVAHGDFAKHYVVEAVTTAGGSPRRVVADISWQGACPKTMKPGDIILPGGAHARTTDLGA